MWKSNQMIIMTEKDVPLVFKELPKAEPCYDTKVAMELP
jgi:hypothetical protein